MKWTLPRAMMSVVVASTVISSVYALAIPAVSRYDTRIQAINYNPGNVVKLNGVVGVATQIVLEPDEEYIAHAFGDPNAWEFSHAANHIFIKPKAENGDTNLIIVTNKRSYNFELHFMANRDQLTTYQLSFRYPDEMAARARDFANQKKLATAFEQKAAPANLNYVMSADARNQAIAPNHVWDDGRFTYFQFRGQSDLPTIYVINPDGSEAIVDRYNQGSSHNTIVLEKVAPAWVLRLGMQVLGVKNLRYNPDGIANYTGTISPAVVRITKGGSA